MGQTHLGSSRINMKAIVIFSSLLIACSSRGLGGRHAQRQHRQHRQHRVVFGQRVRTGRDHSLHEIRAAPTGYFPGAPDYEYEDQAGARADDLAGYGDNELSSYKSGDDQAEGRDQAAYNDSQDRYGDQEQEEYEFQARDKPEEYESDQEQYSESSGAPGDILTNNVEEGYSVPAKSSDDKVINRPVNEEYGAPANSEDGASDLNNSVNEEYGAPANSEDGASDLNKSAEQEYGAPADSDYGAPDVNRSVEEEYGAPAGEDYGAPDLNRSADEEYGAPAGEEYGAPAGEDYGAPDVNRSVDEDYGAPAESSASNIDTSYTDPNGARTAPEYGSGDSDTELATSDEYSAPDEDEKSSRNAFEYSAPADGTYSAPDASRTVNTDYAAPTADGVESDYSAPALETVRGVT